MNLLLFCYLIITTLLTLYYAILKKKVFKKSFNLTLNELLIVYNRKAPLLLYQLFIVKEILIFINRLTSLVFAI